MIMLTLTIDGMHCSMCESHVNDIIRRSEKIKKVTSSHLKNQAKIILEDDLNPNEIISNLEKDGYRVLNTKKTNVKKTLFGYKEI